MNDFISMVTLRYSLEPGDGTRYQFSLSNIESAVGNVHNVISGVDDGYVQLAILMPGCQGSYEVMKSQLREPHPGFVRYFASHISKDMYFPTIVAVILAASVLVDKPRDIDGAVKKMATWGEVYNAWFTED